MKIEIIKEINSAKLFDELLNVGLIMPTQEDGTSVLQGNALYVADDVDMIAVQAVIDAHNPEQLPPQPTSDDYLIDLDFRISMIELGL